MTLSMINVDLYFTFYYLFTFYSIIYLKNLANSGYCEKDSEVIYSSMYCRPWVIFEIFTKTVALLEYGIIHCI